MSSVADMDAVKRDLSNHSLDDLSEDFGHDILRDRVTDLDLSSNYLKSLPPFVSKAFSNIISLDISYNRLTELPLEFCSLQQIRTLHAKCNGMKSLPEGFGRLKSLKKLNLSGNSFEHFPLQICELDGLEYLHLGANFISHITHSIKKLKR